jgi:hypothetical protein
MSYYKIDNLEQYSNIITNLFVNPENFGVRLLKRILLGISNGKVIDFNMVSRYKWFTEAKVKY